MSIDLHLLVSPSLPLRLQQHPLTSSDARFLHLHRLRFRQGLNPTLRSLDKDTLLSSFQTSNYRGFKAMALNRPDRQGVSGQNGILHLESNLSTEKFVNQVTAPKSQSDRSLARTYISKRLERLRTVRSRLSARPSFGARGRTLTRNGIRASGKLPAAKVSPKPLEREALRVSRIRSVALG